MNICRGLLSKETELLNIVEEEKLDIVLLQEIDLLNFSEKLLNIPNFSTFVHNGKKKRTCTLIRDGIFTNVTPIETSHVEPEIWLRVEDKNGRKFTLANIYREWKSDQESLLQQMIDRIATHSSDRLIVAGDFNLDIDRLFDTSYGQRKLTSWFLNEASDAGMTLTSFGKTFHRCVKGREINSALDYVLSSQADLVQNPKKKRYGLSDHDLISWSVPLEQLATRKSEKTATARCYSKIDPGAFCFDLAQQPWEIFTSCSVSEMTTKLNEYTINVLNKHAPLKAIRTRDKKMIKPSKALRKLRRLRDNARSKGGSARLRELRKKCMALSRKEAIMHTGKRLKGDSRQIWNIIGEKLGTKKDNSTNTIKVDGEAQTETQAASLFNQYFISKIETIRNGIGNFSDDPLQGAKRKSETLGLAPNSFVFKTVNEVKVRKAIKKLKSSKCPDIYGIPPVVLKLAIDVLTTPLCWIINSIILEKEVPEVWKVARVLPLHKKKEKHLVENYRPVSILPTFSKVLEELLRLQLSKYLEQNGILPKSQFGFRAGFSTILATSAVYHDWLKFKQMNKKCGTLFFDLSAAFDTLDPQLLTEKLKLYGAACSSTSLITSYLTKRKQCVDYGSARSGLVDIKIGSPQGSILSPLLFLVMVADVQEWIDHGEILSYADDTSCYVAGNTTTEVIKGLESAATGVLNFMKASLLSANPGKTKFLRFSKDISETVKVGGVDITESKAEDLLGITFNKSLNWKSHVCKLESELKQRIGILRKLSYQLPRKVMSNLIDPIFTSKLRYGLELISNPLDANDSVLTKLSALHRQAIKAALRIPKRRHVSYVELLRQSEQKSIRFHSFTSQAKLAWQSIGHHQSHPLTGCRIEQHLNKQNTRQSSNRTFPPQSVNGSVITRLVEIWEMLPKAVKEQDKIANVKRMVNSWSSNFIF